MVPLVFNLGPTELLIILAILLLLFGGARLAGLGKSTGRALREFKEETKDLKGKDQDQALDGPAAPAAPQNMTQAQPPMQQSAPYPQQYPPQQYPPQQYPPQQQPTAEQWPQPPTSNGQPGHVQPGSEVRRDS